MVRCRFLLVLMALLVSSNAFGKVLMLHGGLVPMTHHYFQAAAQLLMKQQIPYDIAPAATVDAAWLDGKTYDAVVVSDYSALTSATIANAALKDFCQRQHVGVIFLYVDAGVSIPEAGLTMTYHMGLPDLRSGTDPLLRSLRTNIELMYQSPLSGRVFEGDQAADGLLFAGRPDIGKPVAVRAPYGQAQGVWIGIDFVDHWITSLLFLDALQWVSNDAIAAPLERWTTVDIDDLFQPSWSDDPRQRTVKIQASDVAAIVDFTDRTAALMASDFKFNAGFNSAFYEVQAGTPPYDDAGGDRAMVAARRHFRWFDHLPGHDVATSFGYEDLVDMMQASRRWAADHDVLPYMSTYTVPPNHSGVFPPYEPLYRAWQDVWGVRYASTMVDIGFRFGDVLVTARRDCGAPCHSDMHSFSQFSRADTESTGDNVIASIIAVDPVSFFMAHQSDFARDRLALVAFGKAYETIATKTRLRLRSGSPEELGDLYERQVLKH